VLRLSELSFVGKILLVWKHLLCFSLADKNTEGTDTKQVRENCEEDFHGGQFHFDSQRTSAVLY